MESGQITLSSLTDPDQILLETATEAFLVFNQTDKNGLDKLDKVVNEESAGEFQKGETITGATSGQTATLLAEDTDSLRLYVSANSKFITGETITGTTSGATGVISKYRANPVENVTQLLDYADVDDTLDDFFSQFRNTFLNSIPTNLTSALNKRNFTKRILQLYQRKGNVKGHKIFFRALLNEEPSITYPRDLLLKVSHGNFNTDTTLKVTLVSPTGGLLTNLIGQTITQTAVVGNDSVNIATAVVDVVTTEVIGTHTVATLSLLPGTIAGTFVSDTRESIIDEDSGDIVGQENFIVSEEDGTSKMLQESIVEFTGTDNTDLDTIITGRIHKIIQNVVIADGGSYYTLAQDVPITEQNGGSGGQLQISQLGQGSIDKIRVEDSGSNYAIGDAIVVDNSNTEGSGLTAKVSVVNGGFLIEQDRQEDGRIITEDEGIVIMEPATNSSLNDITDVRITNFGRAYERLPTLTITSTSGTGASVYPEGGNVGRMLDTLITNTGFRYEAQPTLSPQQHIQIKKPSGTFTIGETISMLNTDDILLEPTFEDDFKLSLENYRPSNLLNEEDSTLSTEFATDVNEGIFVLEDFTDHPVSKLNNWGEYPANDYIRYEDNDIMQITQVFQDEDDSRLITGDITFTELETETGTGNLILEDYHVDEDLLLENATTGTLGDKLIFDRTDSGGSDVGGSIIFEDAVRRLVLIGQELDVIINETTVTATGTVVGYDTARNILSLSNVSGTFEVGETLTGGSSGVTANITFTNPPSVTVTVATTPESPGAYVGVDGFVSENTRVIQDSLVYQDYSYIVKVGESIETWRNDVKRAIHPAGFNLIGQVDIASQVAATMTGGRTLLSGVTETDAVVDLFRLIFGEKSRRKLGTSTDGTTQRSNATSTVDPSVSFASNTRDVTLTQHVRLTGTETWLSGRTQRPYDNSRRTVTALSGIEITKGWIYAGPRLSTINRFALSAFSSPPVTDIELNGTNGSSANAGDNILLEEGFGRKLLTEVAADDGTSVPLSAIGQLRFTGTQNTSIDGELVDTFRDLSLKHRTNFAIPAQVNLK